MLSAYCSVELTDPKGILEELVEHYEEHGTVTRTLEGGRISTVFGLAELGITAKALQARVEADDETSLAYMKLGITYHLREFLPEAELDIRWNGHGEIGVRPPYFREMTVVSATDLTPAMRRIVLSGDRLERFARDGIHARLLFPPKDRAPVWPVTGLDGAMHWPQGEEALLARVYTVRRLDLERRQMTIDILRHDGDATPGSRFAVEARPGDLVGVMGPAGEGLPEARSFLLMGDETAIPAIARLLETLGEDGSARAFIEVAGPQERQPLPCGPNISVEWLQRGERRLSDVVTALKPDDLAADTFVWAGCEFDDFKAIRRHCRAVLGLKRDRHMVAAYWRRGRSEDERVGEE